MECSIVWNLLVSPSKILLLLSIMYEADLWDDPWILYRCSKRKLHLGSSVTHYAASEWSYLQTWKKNLNRIWTVFVRQNSYSGACVRRFGLCWRIWAHTASLPPKLLLQVFVRPFQHQAFTLCLVVGRLCLEQRDGERLQLLHIPYYSNTTCL